MSNVITVLLKYVYFLFFYKLTKQKILFENQVTDLRSENILQSQ